MLLKLCMQLLVGTAVIGSSVYSADRIHDGGGAVAVQAARVGSDRVTFRGVVPNATGGDQSLLNQLVQRVQAPNWNHYFYLENGQNLNNLTAEQLRTLGEHIQELPILAGRQVVFEEQYSFSGKQTVIMVIPDPNDIILSGGDAANLDRRVAASAARVAAREAAIQAGRTGSERVIFQGVFPKVNSFGPHVLDELITQVQNPGWNGVLELHGQGLNRLTVEQLRTLGECIQGLPNLAGRKVVFAAPVFAPTPVDSNRYEVRVEEFDPTLAIPFGNIEQRREVEEIFRLPFGKFIEDPKLKRSTHVLPGWTLGRAWKFLGEFIKHYSSGINEVALLMENARGLDADLKRMANNGIRLMEKASQLWNAMNVEFEKPVDQRNKEIVLRAADELSGLLREVSEFLGFAGLNSPLQALMNFANEQPGDKVFEAFMQSRGGFPVDAAHQAAAPEKTTSEMLDDLLTTKPNKDIAAAVEGAAPGLVKTIRLGGDRLWNVHKLDDPQAAKWQENAQNRHQDYYYYTGKDQQFNTEVVEPCESQFRAVAEKLNLKDGSYTMLVRVPAGGSHQFIVLGFVMRHNFVVRRNRGGNSVSLEKYIGLVEIVEAKDGDEKVPMYDPLRVHGVNSIQGTIMAQRVHAAMEEHRVQQFGKLPENVRVHLREQVEAYSDQRTMNRLENQRLHQYAPTRDEVSLPADALQERMHAYTMSRVHNGWQQGAAYGERLHTLAQSKAAKLSAELKDRFAADRALRMRTHGDDLAVNPSQHMQARVHDLFGERTHIMNSLTPREKEFYRDNKPGGYVDTVERAVAAQQAPFDPRNGPARIHYEGVHSGRIHAERLHGGNHAVAVSAPGAQYGKISDALNDYDLGGNDDGEPGRAAFFEIEGKK